MGHDHHRRDRSRRTGRNLGRDWQSLVIGPPGEQLRNVAGIFNESRALARGGVGAVMGSKRLKAIAVRGTGSVQVYDRPAYDRALQLAFRAVRMSSKTTLLSREGTANILEVIDAMGALPTRNFQSGRFDDADEISGDAFREHSWKKDYACFGCPIACGKWTTPLADGTVIEGPEYETIFALGSNCAIGSRETIIKLNWFCDEYGMDTISVGGVIGFVMEMFQRGIISAAELDGITPAWGDSEAGAGPGRKDGAGRRAAGLAGAGRRAPSRNVTRRRGLLLCT